MTHEQQLREAIKSVVELIKGNGFVIDDSDIMDGNMYITICKPLDEEDSDDIPNTNYGVDGL